MHQRLGVPLGSIDAPRHRPAARRRIRRARPARTVAPMCAARWRVRVAFALVVNLRCRVRCRIGAVVVAPIAPVDGRQVDVLSRQGSAVVCFRGNSELMQAWGLLFYDIGRRFVRYGALQAEVIAAREPPLAILLDEVRWTRPRGRDDRYGLAVDVHDDVELGFDFVAVAPNYS